jgi:cytoskeletal protein RodZ
MNKQALLLLVLLLLQIEIFQSSTINIVKRNFYLIQYQSQPSSAQQLTPSSDSNSYNNDQPSGSHTRSSDEYLPSPSTPKSSSDSSASNSSASKTASNQTSANSTTPVVNTTNNSKSSG